MEFRRITTHTALSPIIKLQSNQKFYYVHHRKFKLMLLNTIHIIPIDSFILSTNQRLLLYILSFLVKAFLARCDQTSNCFDQSDEDNCKLIFMKAGTCSWHELCLFTPIVRLSHLYVKDNYNKKIAPFSFDKEKNVNIPVNINVSMSVIDIIKIEEVNHIYTLKFRLVLEW